MSELDELNDVHTTPAKLARGWAKAYRDGPREARFPSDPDAEFFPRDMDLIAAALAAKDAELIRLRARVAELEAGAANSKTKLTQDELVALLHRAENRVAELEGQMRDMRILGTKRIAELEKPWRAVDGMDWEYIFSAIGHGGRDKFWRAVLSEMHAALNSKTETPGE